MNASAPTLILIFLVALAAAEAAQPSRCIEGELLVKFKGGSRSLAAEGARQAMKHEVKRSFNFIGWEHLQLPEGMSVEQGLARYRELPGMLAVEPNYIEEGIACATPDDPRFSQQWALPKIGAPEAWDLATGSNNVVVAVMDTGINYNHEDLRDNMWRNPGEIPGNGLDDDGNGFVDDIYGIDTADDQFGNDSDPIDQGNQSTGVYHGSQCAGVIGAVGNNGKGIAGINWSVQLMALRVNRINGSSSHADRIEALEYCTLMKQRGINLKIVSMSLAGTNFAQASSDAHAAVGNLGILQVAAAGNASRDTDLTPYYPACYASPGMISVAGSDQADSLALFPSGQYSNYGQTNVDLAAPGLGVQTVGGAGTNTYVGFFSGTSAACPHVAGSAALLFALNPAATVEEVKSALMETVDLVPALTNKMVSHGRLNVSRAAEFLLPPPQLAIERTDGGVRVFWPRPARGFELEETLMLSNPPSQTIWAQVALPYQTNATHIFINTSSSSGNRFYRLRKL